MSKENMNWPTAIYKMVRVLAFVVVVYFIASCAAGRPLL